MNHNLKCAPEPFQCLWDKEKSCEVRFNDRDYEVGDTLNLMEWVGGIGIVKPFYTGRSILAAVKHIQTGFGLPEGLVVMSIVEGARMDQDKVPF